ncbi:MAG TPA: TatD family hydrolase, partial [Vicinamibacterales bacterium]|nr:TatD family hydrolase [Vicinamibacterales bacterium]
AAGDEEESAAGRRVRELWPAVQFAAGVHPHQAGAFAGRPGDAAGVVRGAVRAEGACAIGEIGLDYHYDFAPRNVQGQLFGAQIELARELQLPVVIHTREADDDTFAVLREAGAGVVRGVFHCFTGDRPMAQRALDAGFFVSLSGIATFPKAEELRAVARLVPRDRLLLETDSPYLAPVPFRGRRNEPAFVVEVAAAIARTIGVPPDELRTDVSRNFHALFGPTPSVQTA